MLVEKVCWGGVTKYFALTHTYDIAECGVENNAIRQVYWALERSQKAPARAISRDFATAVDQVPQDQSSPKVESV
jgi:hypothetical protein